MLRDITITTEEVAANEHLAQCKDFCSRFALIAGGTPAVPVVGLSRLLEREGRLFEVQLLEVHLRGHLRQLPNARPFNVAVSVIAAAGDLIED
jgi:hypothetical protein